VHLVHHEQRAMAPELGQVQIRGGGHALVGGDVAGEPPARIGGVIGDAHRQAVAQRLTPVRVGEGFLGLEPQAVAWHDPADAVNDAGGNQAACRDHRQQRLATAWGDRGEDIARLRLVCGDRLNHAREALLMRAKGAGHSGR
jgi:hypothetical protein